MAAHITQTEREQWPLPPPLHNYPSTFAHSAFESAPSVVTATAPTLPQHFKLTKAAILTRSKYISIHLVQWRAAVSRMYRPRSPPADRPKAAVDNVVDNRFSDIRYGADVWISGWERHSRESNNNNTTTEIYVVGQSGR